MLKNIFYFSDERGRCPVRDFIWALPIRERLKALAYIRSLRALGHKPAQAHGGLRNPRTI